MEDKLEVGTKPSGENERKGVPTFSVRQDSFVIRGRMGLRGWTRLFSKRTISTRLGYC